MAKNKKSKQQQGKKRNKKRRPGRQTTVKSLAPGGIIMSKTGLADVVRMSANADSETQDIIWALADPGDCGMRMPTQDGPRTAFFNTRTTVAVGNASVATQGGSPGDTWVHFYGLPALAAMVFEAPRTQTEVRSIMFQNGINSSGTSFIFIRTGGPLLTNTVIDSAWSPIAVTGTNRTEPVGELDQKRYVFLSPGDILKASGTCPAPGVTTWAATMVVNVYRWTSVGEFLYTTTSLSWSLGTAATILFTNQTLAAADTAGWYRIVIESISSTTATGAAGDYTMSATITPLATSGWRMVVPADLDANNSGDGTIGESVRVNGVSMLMTNTTALLSRQGNVIAARIPASEDPFLVDVTMLAGRSDRYMGDASKGLYTFKEFTQFSEEFYDCTDNSIKAMSIRLDRSKDWFHVVQISNSQYATAPNTFLTTFSYTYEFKTSNPRYQQDICRHSWESLLAARRIIQNKPDWFYENPSHMAAIYNLIK